MKTFIRRNFYPIIIIFLTLTVYIHFAGRFNYQFYPNMFNYFSHQAYSFLNGKISLFTTEMTADLSFYDGKKYLYWGPTPVIPILPFIILFGVNFPDTLYTAILGSFTPLLIFLILLTLRKLEFVRIDNFRIFLLSIFFAFGTTHFYQSVIGDVWNTSQVINNLFILISLFLFFEFQLRLNTILLFLSACFFGLAFWGRSSYILYLPFFFIQLLSLSKFKIKINLKKTFVVFISPLLITGLLILIYNFLRFNSLLESGYTYHNFNPYFLSDFEKYGDLNLSYIPRNLFYMFLNFPKTINEYPYLVFDKEGNSILAISPLFALVLLIFEPRFWKEKKEVLFNLSLIFSSLLIIFSLLIFWGTGWVQFGYRYLLDAMPLLLIILARVLGSVPIRLILLLISISILVNTLGTMWILSS